MHATGMQHGNRHSPSDAARTEERFLTVLVYEDGATLDRAHQLYSHLIQKCFEENADLQCVWSSFAALRNSALAANIAESAALADLVIFATHGGTELPPHVKAWIETWLPQKKLSESALVALVGMPEDNLKGITPIHEYLRGVADRGHMDFIQQLLNQDADWLGEHLDDAVSQTNAPGWFRFPPGHWGINE